MTQRLNARDNTGDLRRRLAALLLFGVSFGFVEASVVEYLRFVWQPIHARCFPQSPVDSIFPILTLDQLRAEGPEHMRVVYTELVREAATLVMLAAAGLATAHSLRQWFAAFMVVFGIWDIFFYIFLKVLLNWPQSLATWDLLFLLPLPWVGPVWSPILVSLAMIVAGVIVLRRDALSRPVLFSGWHVMGIAAGGLTVIVAFCWDWRNIVAGGEPNPFQWPLFALGLTTGFISFLHAAGFVSSDRMRARSNTSAYPSSLRTNEESACG